MNRQSIIEKFYLRFEYLAYNYAKQIFNYERSGYEYQDIIQELKIKIYTSILGYAHKWQEYKQTGKYKPVPIKFYIKTALINRTKDFIKQFNQETVENVNKISINQFDYGVYNTMVSRMDLNKRICTINGVDLFHKISEQEKKCFALYLKGFPMNKLLKVFPKIIVPDLINKQLTYLNSRKEDLLDYVKIKYTQHDCIAPENGDLK
jgi:hypothetical protein